MGTAVITGANRGIGLELARQLKHRGADVVAVCRSRSKALDALGVRVEADIDVTQPSAWSTLAQRFARDDIGLLVHNAGMPVEDSLADVTPEEVRAQMTGGHGMIDADESVRGLLARIDELTLATTGRFTHQNGTELPW